MPIKNQDNTIHEALLLLFTTISIKNKYFYKL